jgi:hypothetical protein
MAVCKHERAADDSGVPVGEGYLRAGGALAYASFGACELWRGGGSLCDRSPFPLPVIGMLDLDVCAMHMERALRVVKIHVAHAPARDQGGGKARAPSIHIEPMAHAFHLCILRSASSISCSIFYCDMPWLHQPFWHALLPTR